MPFNVRKYLRRKAERKAAKALLKANIRKEMREGKAMAEELWKHIEEAEKFANVSGAAVLALRETREQLMKDYAGIACDTLDYFKTEITGKLKGVVNELQVPVGPGMSVEGKVSAAERIGQIKLRLRRQLRDLDDIDRLIKEGEEATGRRGRKRGRMAQWRLVTVDEFEAKRMTARNLAQYEFGTIKKVKKKKAPIRPKGILKKKYSK